MYPKPLPATGALAFGFPVLRVGAVGVLLVLIGIVAIRASQRDRRR